MKFALHLDEDGRVLSATYAEFAFEGNVLLEALPEGDITAYRYENGAFLYDPLPEEEPEALPTPLDVLEAQVTYTAMMTDTLLKEV